MIDLIQIIPNSTKATNTKQLQTRRQTNKIAKKLSHLQENRFHDSLWGN